MAHQPGITPTPPGATGVPAKQAYMVTGVCLVVGLAVGYFLMHVPPKPPRVTSQAATTASPTARSGGHPQLTLEQMKQMADVQASALIEKSNLDPRNSALLIQIAGIYQATHQFKDAAEYFERALKIEPKNVSARTQLASCLYYSGDVDGALAQLVQALKDNPNDEDSLFNLGMIKYRGKNDPKGAVAAWQELLRRHPDLSRKPIVEKMIAEAQQAPAEKK